VQCDNIACLHSNTVGIVTTCNMSSRRMFMFIVPCHKIPRHETVLRSARAIGTKTGAAWHSSFTAFGLGCFGVQAAWYTLQSQHGCIRLHSASLGDARKEACLGLKASCSFKTAAALSGGQRCGLR
jgi:hypothetical protein